MYITCCLPCFSKQKTKKNALFLHFWPNLRGRWLCDIDQKQRNKTWNPPETPKNKCFLNIKSFFFKAYKTFEQTENKKNKKKPPSCLLWPTPLPKHQDLSGSFSSRLAKSSPKSLGVSLVKKTWVASKALAKGIKRGIPICRMNHPTFATESRNHCFLLHPVFPCSLFIYTQEHWIKSNFFPTKKHCFAQAIAFQRKL